MWRRFSLAAGLLSVPSMYCIDTTPPNTLAEYTWDEISKHKTPGESVWLVVGSGVYDVTRFVDIHPGGNKILLAAGGSADQFWGLYRIHHQEKVYQLLESMRIGNLKAGEKVSEVHDMYKNDPSRNSLLVKHSEKPFNAELPNDLLPEHMVSPNSEFFIRNHLPVPEVDLSTYQLEVVYEDDKCTSFTLEELKTKFPVVTVESTIQCAGNRRYEANQHIPTRGVEWRGGAIGNAIWTGVRLSDVLSYLGALSPQYQHVQFEGLDSDPNGPFGTSIPMVKALHPDTILAFEMNGEPIPRDHGFPIRLVVPGYVGVRNVKWVKRITLSSQESDLIWHRRDYRLFSPNDSLSSVVFEDRQPIYETPVQSIICSPLDGAGYTVEQEEVVVRGFAYAGGGRGIARVEVTGDGGETWTEAKVNRSTQPLGRHWTWSLWEARVRVEDIQGGMCVRAVDSAGNTQPEKLTTVWNYRGLLSNQWHCIHMMKKLEKEEVG